MAQFKETGMPDESPRNGALPISDDLSMAELSHQVAAEAGIGENQAEKAVRIVQQSSLRVGPYPSADEIARYNAINPGLGTRLVENFLAQQQHGRQCDDLALTIAEQDSAREDGRLNYARVGQIFGFILTLAFLLSALFCAFVLHQFWLAGLFIAGPTIRVVAPFVRGAGRE